MSKLLVVNDGKRERELMLVETLVFGRDPACDFSHDDALLSRRHAEFATARDEVTVRDLGSRNGIFVNGTRAAERSLRPGDIVQIGPLRVRYLAERAPVGLAATDLDMDSTIMLPSDAGRTDATPAPPAAAVPALSDEEGETRVFQPTPEIQRLVAGAESSEFDATVVLPPRTGSGVRTSPVTPAPASGVRPGPVAAPPPAGEARISASRRSPASGVVQPAAQPEALANHSTLTTFVYVQLAALASVVFVASAVPLIMWRGETLGSTEQGGVMALLRWPALPMIVVVVATYVIASLVNRRFQAALRDAKQDGSRGARG